MYLCKEIANKYRQGGKGHATVIYAANRIKQSIETDKELNSDILKIKSPKNHLDENIDSI